MMLIRCVYSEEPPFPPEDQAPDVKRIDVGDLWVDFIGDTAPTQQDVDLFLNPPATPREVALNTDAGVVDLLPRLATATPAQIDAWLVANVTNLAQARAVLGTLVKTLALYLRTT